MATSAAPTTEIAPGLYRLELGFVNAYLVDVDGELTLVDTGYPDAAESILAAVGQLGHRPTALAQILVTHAHFDHSGSAPKLREHTGAKVLMSQPDAELIRGGFSSRGLKIRPGFEEIVHEQTGGMDLSVPAPTEPFNVDGYLSAGTDVPGIPDAELISTPGHCAGQLSLLWHRHGGVLLTGDAAANIEQLGTTPVAEDFERLRTDFIQLAERDFAVAAFGHGPPVSENATAAFRAAIPNA